MFLTLLSSVSKGQFLEYTLTKDDLASLPIISTFDSYLQDHTNWKKVVCHFVSDEGNQSAFLSFVLDETNTANASMFIHPKARDQFVLKSVSIFDFQNGRKPIMSVDIPDIESYSLDFGALNYEAIIFDNFNGFNITQDQNGLLTFTQGGPANSSQVIATGEEAFDTKFETTMDSSGFFEAKLEAGSASIAARVQFNSTSLNDNIQVIINGTVVANPNLPTRVYNTTGTLRLRRNENGPVEIYMNDDLIYTTSVSTFATDVGNQDFVTEVYSDQGSTMLPSAVAPLSIISQLDDSTGVLSPATNGSQTLGQEFTPEEAFSLTSVKVSASKTGSPNAALHCRVMDENNNVLGFSTNSIELSSFSGDKVLEFQFAEVALSSGVQYKFDVYMPSPVLVDGSNYWGLKGKSVTDPYQGGDFIKSLSPFSAGWDLWFKIYGQ